VEYYNRSIVNNPQVEFIFVSQDAKLEDALKWALSAKHPWLTVLKPQARASGLQRYDAGTPSYLLIDANGKILATTEKGCMRRIRELTGR
jgi:hypothetical protein